MTIQEVKLSERDKIKARFREIINGWEDAKIEKFKLVKDGVEMDGLAESAVFQELVDSPSCPDYVEWSDLQRFSKILKSDSYGKIIDLDLLFVDGSPFIKNELDGLVQFNFEIPMTQTRMRKLLHFPCTKEFRDLSKLGFILSGKERLIIYILEETNQQVFAANTKLHSGEVTVYKEHQNFREYFGKEAMRMIAVEYRRVVGVQRKVFSEFRERFNKEAEERMNTRRGKDTSQRVRKSKEFKLSTGELVTAKQFAAEQGCSERHALRVLKKIGVTK